MQSLLQKIVDDTHKRLGTCQTLEELKELEIQILGRKGELTKLLKGIKDLSKEEKATFGKQMNIYKKQIKAAFSEKEQTLKMDSINEQLQQEKIDISEPGTPTKVGSLHPLNQLQREVEDIFTAMGFSIADGPEIESEQMNFEHLNVPADHPARDMQDTFFIDQEKDTEHGHLVLRTHTSPVQVRSMQKFGAPLRLIVPGRVFRYEATDATHDSTFHQVEGMFIDKNVSLADLKGVMTEFLTRLFKRPVKTRFRPGYFPFVEPGIELDMSFPELGKKTEWMEFMGAGMVHPNVLKAGGIDPEKYQGWAFGFGLTRLAMMRYNIPDVRMIFSSDTRFIEQF